MATECGYTERELALDRQWAVADNLMLRDGVLCSRPGLKPVSDTVTLESGSTMTVSREASPVADADGRYRLRRTVCFVDADKKYAVLRTAALYSDGTFAEDGASSPVHTPNTTVLCVPCAMDIATDTLLYTGNGQVLSAGGGVLVDEQDSVRVPVVWSDGRGAATLQDNRPTAGYAAQAANLLTSRFEARYTADDTGCVFYLPFGDIDDALFTVTVRDMCAQEQRFTVQAHTQVSQTDDTGLSLHVDRAVGRFWFVRGGVPVPPPLRGCENNIRAFGYKEALTRGGLVYGCTFGSWFGEPGAVADGGRLFVSGNPLYPNTVCCSAVGDPFYFPDDTVYALGRSREAVTAFARQGNALIVFKENALFGVAYNSVDKTGFPIACLHEQVGCDCPQSIVPIDGRLLWATSDGAVWRLKSVDNENRCTLQRLSGEATDTMAAVSAADWRAAVACEVDGHYFVAAGPQGFWLSEPEKPVWFRWKWTTACRVLAACSREGQTGLMLADNAGHIRGCVLSGDTDGLPVLGIPVEVAADTGLLYDTSLSKRRMLHVQLRLQGRASVTPYDECGDGRTLAVQGAYDRLPVRRSGVRRFGVRLTATAPFMLEQARLVCRP